MRWIGACFGAALVLFGAFPAEAQTRAGQVRTASMMISVTVVRSDGGPKAIAAPDSTGASLDPTETAAPAPTANPSPQPVAVPPRQAETAVAVVGSSATGSRAVRILTINF